VNRLLVDLFFQRLIKEKHMPECKWACSRARLSDGGRQADLVYIWWAVN